MLTLGDKYSYSCWCRRCRCHRSCTNCLCNLDRWFHNWCPKSRVGRYTCTSWHIGCMWLRLGRATNCIRQYLFRSVCRRNHPGTSKCTPLCRPDTFLHSGRELKMETSVLNIGLHDANHGFRGPIQKFWRLTWSAVIRVDETVASFVSTIADTVVWTVCILASGSVTTWWCH